MNDNGKQGDSGKPRILIIGGVAGGASCATRLRRLSESAEITIFERGPYVSFANCGLPYYVGDVIADEKKLLVATPGLFRKRFNIDVRTQNEVLSIDRHSQEITIKNRKTGAVYNEGYDALVFSPGSSPIRPPLPGIELPGIFTLRTIPDSRQIREWIAQRGVERALIVGGGFIGLEMAENLVKRGVSVTIVEMLSQVMPTLDADMAVPIHNHLIANGVTLALGDAVSSFTEGPGGNIIEVATKSGHKYTADMVILAIGVRPEIGLAREAGLEIGERGGVRVDEHMRTSDQHIWAVGDAVEVQDFITGSWINVPLAGPANREGRIAADNILGRKVKFRGVQATAICQVFDMTIASTGTSEKVLKRSLKSGQSIPYEKVFLHTRHHVEYYPNSTPMTIKLIFSTTDGRILGAQAVGGEGVDKRIDVISMAIQRNSTVFDLEQCELCYAPQFGAAKDPVNIAGMIAANALRGDAPVAHWENADLDGSIILDVREPGEFDTGHVPRAINIPLGELRGRLGELDRNRQVLVYCAVGQRSYYASRLLLQHGIQAKNISGGFSCYAVWKQIQSDSH